MFPNLTMLLQSDPNMKCHFTQGIASHLTAINTAIERHCLGIKKRHNFLWISKPFLVEENSICDDDDNGKKTESVGLREDLSFKADFTGKDIGNFWAGFQIKYFILLKKALSFF